MDEHVPIQYYQSIVAIDLGVAGALPPLRRYPGSDESDSDVAVTVIGLIVYVVVTSAAVVLVAT